jgi:hypothetical protein
MAVSTSATIIKIAPRTRRERRAPSLHLVA